MSDTGYLKMFKLLKYLKVTVKFNFFSYLNLRWKILDINTRMFEGSAWLFNFLRVIQAKFLKTPEFMAFTVPFNSLDFVHMA